MSTTQKPVALRLADKYEVHGFLSDQRYAKDYWCSQAAAELRRQHARIAELEAQLSAIGAGGVEPLRKRAVEEVGEDTLTMAAAIIMQREADARDAARYRWLRNQMLGVDFDWCGNGITALVFEVPDGCAYSRNCDQNIDAAVAVQAKQGEQSNG